MAAAQPQGGFTVTVKHERTTHAVEVDGGATVALLQTRLFLRSNVLPTRQKLRMLRLDPMWMRSKTVREEPSRDMP